VTAASHLVATPSRAVEHVDDRIRGLEQGRRAAAAGV
jgi:hypothetical protein